MKFAHERVTGGLQIERSVTDLLRTNHRAFAKLTITSASTGLSEAGILVVLTLVGVGLAGGGGEVDLPLLGATRMTHALALGFALTVFRVLAGIATAHLAASLSATVMAEKREQLIGSYLAADWARQATEPKGRLQELLTTYVDRTNSLVNYLSSGLTGAVNLLAFVIVSGSLNIVVTSVLLFLLTIIGLAVQPLRRSIQRRARTLASSNITFAEELSELSSLTREMQVFGLAATFTQRLSKVSRGNVGHRRRLQFGTNVAPHFYIGSAYLFIFLGAAALAALQPEGLAVLAAVMMLLIRSLSYGQQVYTAVIGIESAKPFVDGLAEIVTSYTQSRRHTGDLRPAKVGRIELNNVSYQYSSESTALENITLQINPGELIGVIGPSGAGKSTLAEILLGLREPSSGSARFNDGMDIANIDIQWLAERVGFVSQDAKLISGSVANNIRFFRDGIDHDTVERALHQTNLMQEVSNMPHGDATLLGRGGRDLSGGQKQRVAIARSLVHHHELLVLDEPTSALDSFSEQQIRDTLLDLKGRSTVVIIAHRISTLDDCDRILVLQDGKITGFDTPTNLLKTNPYYIEVRTSANLAGVDEGGS